jgi:hypothetical protein
MFLLGCTSEEAGAYMIDSSGNLVSEGGTVYRPLSGDELQRWHPVNSGRKLLGSFTFNKTKYKVFSREVDTDRNILTTTGGYDINLPPFVCEDIGLPDISSEIPTIIRPFYTKGELDITDVSIIAKINKEINDSNLTEETRSKTLQPYVFAWFYKDHPEIARVFYIQQIEASTYSITEALWGNNNNRVYKVSSNEVIKILDELFQQLETTGIAKGFPRTDTDSIVTEW